MSSSPRPSEWLLAGFVIIALLAMVWPGYELAANRGPFFVAGLPFVICWNIGWLFAMFLAVLTFHLTRDEDT